MKTRSFGKAVILILCLIFLFSALAFAQSREVVRVRGTVATLNAVTKMIRVNERAYVWNRNTRFYDETGSAIKAEGLKKNIRVSIEARVIPRKPCLIKTLHILPTRSRDAMELYIHIPKA